VGQDDRPEDETRAESEEPLPGTPGVGEQPEPELEPAEPEPEPELEPAEPEPEEPGPPKRRVLRVLVALGGLLLVALLLVGWNRVASSDSFCASCHEVESAAQAAARSVHQDVPCIACHTGPGLAGALRYLPTLARETITEFTPWNIAHGVLEARSCESCHANIATTPELAAAHATGAGCATCHGDVAHPPFRLAGFARPTEPVEGDVHPRLYVQTHGDDVVDDPDSCIACHSSNFCEACHLRETYPHPNDWITEHGPTQQDLGIDACIGCHPQTFCAGCHGTEIPHNVRWLGEHWRDLQDAPVTPCLLCHPKPDCTTCHAKHSVHREQDLYVGGSS